MFKLMPQILCSRPHLSKDKDGNEQVVAAVSRTFTKTERGYAIFKQEILALLYTLKAMDYFLHMQKSSLF